MIHYLNYISHCMNEIEHLMRASFPPIILVHARDASTKKVVKGKKSPRKKKASQPP